MNRVAKSGFTLIELMLAMAFIAMLLLAIAMLVINVSTTYNKGLSLKEINQASREIAADLDRSLTATSALDIPTDGSNTSNIVSVKDSGVVTGGGFCTGEYSYLWNTNQAISEDNSNLIKNNGVPVRFTKVPDPSLAYCRTVLLGSGDVLPTDVQLAQELLAPGEHSLALNSFNVVANTAARDYKTGQALYNFNFIIGSGKVSAMNSDQTACLGPGEEGTDLSYCNVQEFTLVLRAGIGG